MDDPLKLDLEEAMQRLRRFCELRPSYPDYAMIAHSDYSDAIRMGHLRALCVPPEALRNLSPSSKSESAVAWLRRVAGQADPEVSVCLSMAADELDTGMSKAEIQEMQADVGEAMQILGKALTGDDGLHIGRLPDMAREICARSPLARKCRHGYREENCGLCHPELEPKETPQSGA